MTFEFQKPIGYMVEWRPGDPCFYSVEDMAREGERLEAAEVRALFLGPQKAGQEPAAWHGRYWCAAKHRSANAYMDPDAVPCYAGPVLNRPGISLEVASLFQSFVIDAIRSRSKDGS